MNKKFEYPVGNWCFGKLEQRILLSGEAMVEPVEPQESSDTPEQGAEVVTVDENAVVEMGGIEEYQPEVDGVLVDLSGENVLPEQDAAMADVLPEENGLTDIHLTPDEILQAPEALVIDDNEILTGSGEIDGSVVNDGTVSPGNSPGIQTVDTYSQTAEGTLIMEIGGISAGPGEEGDVDNGYDQINVSGSASFDGILDIRLINDFTPTAGQVFDIITYGSRIGESGFASYEGLYIGDGLYFKPVYQADKLQLVVEELPDGLLRDAGESAELQKLAEFAATALPGEEVVVSGGFDLAGQTLEGEFTFRRSADDTGFDVLFSDLGITVEAGAASGSLVDASGALYIADDGAGVAGSLSGTLSFSGLTGVSLGGTVSYGFNSIDGAVNRTIGSTDLDFTGKSATSFSGSLTLGIDNLASLSGDFVVRQNIVDGVSSFQIDGSNIASSVGSGATLSAKPIIQQAP